MLNIHRTRYASLALTLIGAGACRAQVRQHEDRSPARQARHELQEAIARRMTPALGSIDTAAVRMRQDTSRVIGHLRYIWASYRPQSTADVHLFAVAAVVGDNVKILRSPQDWSDVVGDWRPTSTRDAIGACKEIVVTVGPGRDPVQQPILYEPPYRPQGAAIVDPKALAKWGTAPSAARQKGTWESRVTVLEAGRAAKYECHFSQNGSVSLRLIAVLPGTGQFPTGP